MGIIYNCKKTERSGEGNGNLLQYSCLENPLDRGAWWATVHGVARVGYDWTTDTHTQLRYLMVQGHTFSTLPSPAGSRMGQAAPGRQGDSPHPHPFWKSWGLSAWTAGLGPIKTKLFTGKKKKKPELLTQDYTQTELRHNLRWFGSHVYTLKDLEKLLP